MGRINLDNGRFIGYEIVNNPKGENNIIWREYTGEGKTTGKVGDISKNGESEIELIMDNYRLFVN
ncbi:MAG: hypothetical protein Q8P15_00460 [Nanoarchaeota archaeon]|nr:hypothetical protein [Nanoarchaeota archaeon]